MRIFDALLDFDRALEWALDDDELFDTPAGAGDALEGADAPLGTS